MLSSVAPFSSRDADRVGSGSVSEGLTQRSGGFGDAVCRSHDVLCCHCVFGVLALLVEGDNRERQVEFAYADHGWSGDLDGVLAAGQRQGEIVRVQFVGSRSGSTGGAWCVSTQ